MNEADFKILRGASPGSTWELTPDAKLRQRALELAVELAPLQAAGTDVLATAKIFFEFMKGDAE